MTTQTSSVNPKTVAIVSYLTIIGWIIALVLNKPRSEFAAFHLRQSLGLIVLAVVVRMFGIIPVIGGLLVWGGSILLLVGWVLGLVAAIKEEKAAIPFVGAYFQDWFKGL